MKHARNANSKKSVMIIKRPEKKNKPCVKCNESYMIYDKIKWLCKSCSIKIKKEKSKEKNGYENLSELFTEIWTERKHICVKCGKKLQEIPKLIYFSHIKSRGARIDLKFKKDNIELLCEECHDKHEFGNRV